MQPYFPNLAFAVAFVTVLAVGLAYAAWIDWTTMRVPKWLTMGLLGSGIFLNVIRGGWVAAEGANGWLPSAGSPLLGMLDGFLIAASGVATGFGFFFLLWIFGVAGGGDVKLAAAIGAWFGAILTLVAVVFAIPFLMLIALLTLGYKLLGGKLPKSFATASLPGHPKTRRGLMGYALPLGLGSYVILFVLVKGYWDYLNGVVATSG